MSEYLGSFFFLFVPSLLFPLLFVSIMSDLTQQQQQRNPTHEIVQTIRTL